MGKKAWLVIYLCIGLTALVPRVYGLDAFLSPDEPQWERNTLGFREGLMTGQAELLYQQPHPGITTTWLAVPTITASSWGTRRLPIAVATTGLILICVLVMKHVLNETIAILAGIILALDPLFIAHSRVLAMDALLAGFLLVAVLLLLLWIKEHQQKWLIASGAAASLAILSKMSGALIVPFTIVVIGGEYLRGRISRPLLLRSVSYWASAAVVTAVIILPTIVTNPQTVWEGTMTFFTTEHFSQTVHALGPYWYPEALLLWSTPLIILAIIPLPLVWRRYPGLRQPLAMLILFALCFFLLVQYSIKKGDRYLLPFFLFWDVTAAVAIAAMLTHARRVKSWSASAFLFVCLMALGWQLVNLFQIHPHELAYRNPWFRPVAQARTMGWGEGLELAAKYLNEKPNASQLLVASYYEASFQYRFTGSVTSAERLAKETAADIGADYVVLYRTMEGRAPDRWETKVLQAYAEKKPEHVIQLNHEPYVWIYRVK